MATGNYRPGGTCPLCGAVLEVHFPDHLMKRCSGNDKSAADQEVPNER